eukprot:TRINITY_DN2099_c0_g1_i2.p1 TRINITY_DN2099_c0_g1~~TRINITY_DN2099_c0_g1_i2.p1  ORF type:complete len:275 (+),score=43.69 TRINITY_DN2099_c0_g1_i2:1741-2565(+)
MGKRRMIIKDLKDPQNERYYGKLQAYLAKRFSAESLAMASSSDPVPLTQLYSNYVFERIRNSPSAIACVCLDADTDEIVCTMSLMEFARVSDAMPVPPDSPMLMPMSYVNQLDRLFWQNLEQQHTTDPVYAELHTLLQHDAACTDPMQHKVMEIGRATSTYPGATAMCLRWICKRAYNRGVRAIVARFNDAAARFLSTARHMKVLISLEYRKSCLGERQKGETGDEPRFQFMNTKVTADTDLGIVQHLVGPDYCRGNHFGVFGEKDLASMVAKL